jgi:hypothetical protein
MPSEIVRRDTGEVMGLARSGDMADLWSSAPDMARALLDQGRLVTLAVRRRGTHGNAGLPREAASSNAKALRSPSRKRVSSHDPLRPPLQGALAQATALCSGCTSRKLRVPQVLVRNCAEAGEGMKTTRVRCSPLGAPPKYRRVLKAYGWGRLAVVLDAFANGDEHFIVHVPTGLRCHPGLESLTLKQAMTALVVLTSVGAWNWSDPWAIVEMPHDQNRCLYDFCQAVGEMVRS